MRVGFLLNHYAPHQLYHSVPIAFALSRAVPEIDVVILASQREQLDAARRIGAQYAGHRCRFVRLRVPFGLALAARLLGGFMSVNIRKATRRANIAAFAACDILVVPEKNSLALKQEPVLAHLKFVRIRHGAGDRETGLDDSNAQFDLILASGRKMVDRLAAIGVSPDRCRVVGYPKFDAVAAGPPPRRLFDNDRPVVLYNPHFKPEESSWPRCGLAVLEFFCRHPEYNLIFAPHVMLYKRGGRRHGARSLRRYRSCRNIHLDTGSPASVDMSYTRQADIYLGDVSSQVYEFLLRPRPCIFLNAHHVDWQGNINFAHWRGGQVIEDIGLLGDALRDAAALQPGYEPLQRDLFAYTFDLNDTPSAVRGAAAILRSGLLPHTADGQAAFRQRNDLSPMPNSDYK